MNFLEGIIYMIWRGVAIGVIISAPMGPVGILCVQRTLEKGRRTGLFTGVGAAISDLFYCLLTGFGLSLIEEFLKANQNIIQIVGSVVLIVFGIYLFRSNPARTLKKPEAAVTSRSKDLLQGFLFTVSNPLIIFLIIGLFARFNFLLPEINWIQYIIGYISIIGGALLWWWIVTFFIDKVRSHFNLRSMWLVNRITGAIIMIFAIVGIVTAFSGIANAAEHRIEYLNSSRGFGELGTVADNSPLVIENSSSSNEERSLSLGRSRDFSIAFRADNLHCRPGKKWSYQTADGEICKVSFPGWGIALKGEGHVLCFNFKTLDNLYDELYSPTMAISTTFDGEKIDEKTVSGDLAFFDGWNSFSLKADGESYVLLGGIRSYNPLFAMEKKSFRPDSISFVVEPGGALSLDYIKLELPDATLPESQFELSHFANPDVRETYFSRSDDQIEGVWEIFDYSLDDTKLREGGSYRVVLVKEQGGYKIIYIEGAQKNAAAWRPGALKGHLRATAFRNVYDVSWLDPESVNIEGRIKAQFSSPDLFTFHFVDHDSELRFRKIAENYRKR